MQSLVFSIVRGHLRKKVLCFKESLISLLVFLLFLLYKKDHNSSCIQNVVVGFFCMFLGTFDEYHIFYDIPIIRKYLFFKMYVN